MKKLVISVIAALLAVNTAWAADEGIKIEEVVVTATRLEESVEETTSEVIVITGAEIMKMQVEFVPDVLRRVAGINVVQNGAEGKVATVFMRGGASTHTLVMIDGVKVNGTTTGSYDFSGLNVEDIERIEIVKGPQSTTYGSEAMAGVINIITKKGKGGLSAHVTMEGGSHGTWNPTVSVSGARNWYDYRISASYFNTEGISVASAGTEKDGYENASASWRFGYSPKDTFDIELLGMYRYDRSELDGFDFMTGLAADDTDFLQHGHRLMVSAKARLLLFDKWEQNLTLSRYDESSDFSDPTDVFSNYQIEGSTRMVDWQNNIFVTEPLTIAAGLEYRQEEGENKGNFSETVDNRAVYLLGKYTPMGGALVLNAGIRYDDHETAGSKATWRAGAVYNIAPLGLGVRASYATAFRAPALNDLYFPFFGNPDLEPEESKAFEIGLEKTFMEGRAKIAANYFDQDYENLIQADPMTYTAQNIADADIKGFEAEASLGITESLFVTAAYTHLDTEDRATGEPLPRRPDDKVSATVDYTRGALAATASVIYVGERFDSAAGAELDSYVVVNLSGSYKLYKNISVFARVENLLDEDYEEVRGYGTKGLSAYGGVRAAF